MSDRPPRYFAYGSNLHPLRLGLRTPSARPLGQAVLAEHVVRFHKRSDGDGSAKADAHYTGRPADRVLGVVYELHPDDYPALDAVEGLGSGGYELRSVAVDLGGRDTEVFVYTALPTHVDAALTPWSWYRDLVWLGAQWHGMPDDYVHTLRRVPAEPDPDAERHAQHAALLEVMPRWRPEHGFRLP